MSWAQRRHERSQGGESGQGRWLEGEGVCVLSNLLRHDSCTWSSIMVPTGMLSSTPYSSATVLMVLLNLFTDLDELLFEASQRNHDLGRGSDPARLSSAAALCDGANLHNVELWVDKTKAAATEAEHWVSHSWKASNLAKSTLCSGVIPCSHHGVSASSSRGNQRELTQWWSQEDGQQRLCRPLPEGSHPSVSTAKLLNSKLLTSSRSAGNEVLNEVLTLTKEHNALVKTNCLSAVRKSGHLLELSAFARTNDATTGLVKTDPRLPALE